MQPAQLLKRGILKVLKKEKIALIQKPIINFGAKTWNTNKKKKKLNL